MQPARCGHPSDRERKGYDCVRDCPHDAAGSDQRSGAGGGAEAEINSVASGCIDSLRRGALRKYWRRMAFEDDMTKGSERIARQAYRRAVLRYPLLNA